MNLALPNGTEAQLRDLAQQQGVSTETYITRLLEAHAQQRDLATASETQLLQLLSLGFNEAQWERYETLKKRRREETLGSAEQAELIALSDRLEEANAKRMAALAELSKRRGTPLRSLMTELGLVQPVVGE